MILILGRFLLCRN